MVAPYTYRPAVRENTPLVIGIAGPTKSGKTYSALRLARGLAPQGPIVMLNAEGARGHQYADKFTYLTCDLEPPYRYGVYEDALRASLDIKPGAVIIDSMSHAHDGPGGFLEWHEQELDRIAGKEDQKARDRSNFTAWIKPKAAENSFRYAVLAMPCPVILCMRAKEKIKIVSGKPPIDLGWQPIVGESIAFETIFTLTLPPHSKGVPDLEMSELREPFDTLIPKGKPIDEELGKTLTEWARGVSASVVQTLLSEVQAVLVSRYPGQSTADKEAKSMLLEQAFGTRGWSKVQAMDEHTLRAGIAKLRQPVEVSNAQETDRRGADLKAVPQGPDPVGDPRAQGTESAGSAAPRKVTPSNEPSKVGDEPAPGLFPTAQQMTPAPKAPAPAPLPGVDVDDEAQALAKEIEAEKAKLERQPPDDKWELLCSAIVGTAVLEMADPSTLRELLDLVRQLVAQDPAAIERVTGILEGAA